MQTCLREEFLFKAVQAVNTTFQLGGSSALFEANNAVLGVFLEHTDTAAANILQGVLKTGSKVGNKLANGALVDNIADNTLSNLDGITFGEVALGGSIAILAILVVHGIN